MTHLQRAFERWYEGNYVKPDTSLERGTGDYANPTTRAMWDAFKAGRAYIQPARVTA